MTPTPYQLQYDSSLTEVKRQLQDVVANQNDTALCEWINEVQRMLNKVRYNVEGGCIYYDQV